MATSQYTGSTAFAGSTASASATTGSSPFSASNMSMYGYMASTGLSSYASIRQGIAGKEEMEGNRLLSLYNARVGEQNARMTEARTTFEQIRHQRTARRIMGRLRARLGASGAVISEGAPLMVLAEQASELALESALIGAEGRTRAEQYRSRAAFDVMQARLFRDRGKSAMEAGYINAGTTLLSGFTTGQQQGMW